MATNAANAQIGVEHLAPEEPSQLVIIWRRFSKHKLALFGLVTLSLLALACILGPLLTGYAYDQIDNDAGVFANFSAQHLLGTDEIGRDLLTRLLYAGRISLFVGVAVTLLVVTIGAIYGALAGYNPGIFDTILMRFVDLLLSLPFLPLLLLLSVFFHAVTDTWQVPSILGFTGNDVKAIVTILIILSLFGWLGISRLVRGSVLSLRNLDFVEATRALGAGPRRIIFNHLLPNSLAPIIVASTPYVGEVIILESALSFLGLGINPPTPSWGNMLNAVQAYMWGHPLLAFYPGFLILLTVLSINFMGDAMRDALDPRLKM
jgi:peptide/nickel transport system permease protein